MQAVSASRWDLYVVRHKNEAFISHPDWLKFDYDAKVTTNDVIVS